MPETEMPIPFPDRSTMAMGERVARVETKIEGIEKDTAIIRAAIHDIKNEQQKYVLVEQQCANNLAALTTQITAHTEQIGTLVKAVADLAAVRAQGEGAWWAFSKFMSASVALVGALAALTGATFWMLGHLTVAVK